MPPPPAPPTSPPRLQLPVPGVALALLSESALHRAELTLLELEEAGVHARGSTLLAGAAGALVLFTGFAFTLMVASLVWDNPHRIWWLGGLCFAYLAATFATGFALAHRLRTWRPLGEIRGQLQQDCQCLAHLIKSAAS